MSGSMLIKNGIIYTMSSGVIENGYVYVEDGIIADIGAGEAPSGSGGEIIDAGGAYVLPGLIDAHCHIGLFGNALGFEGEDGNEESDPFTPHMRALDGVNPMDLCFGDALEGGVTTVVTAPGSANAAGGAAAAIKTFGRRIDDMVIREPAAVKFALGENPKTIHHSKDRMPYTRMATAALIRENLMKAQEYLRKKDSYESDPDTDAPDLDIRLESLLPLLRGEISAHFHAHRADDICTAIRLAREFNLKYVILHATEGHLITDILASEGASVITGPALCDRSKPELAALSFKTPGILSAGGVTTAICTDHPVTPIQYLTLCAALAVKNGMSEHDALAAITINAAIIAGIDSRVGSIERGKDADLVIFTAHPLSLESKVRITVVNGKTAYNFE